MVELLGSNGDVLSSLASIDGVFTAASGPLGLG